MKTELEMKKESEQAIKWINFNAPDYVCVWVYQIICKTLKVKEELEDLKKQYNRLDR